MDLQIDRVKINDITEFSTPKGLADKVVKVELSKDGVFEADIVSYGQSTESVSKTGNKVAYDIEYKIDSSRGKNHYNIKTTVIDKKLYVFTVQCKEDAYAELADTSKAIIDSFKIEDSK